MKSTRIHTWHILAIVFVHAVGCASECIWDITKDIPQKDPLFYQKSGRSYRLLVPSSKRGVVLKKDQELQIACPGPKNYVQKLGRETASLRCENGTNAQIDGLSISVHDLQCVKHVSSEIKKTDKACANGTLLNVGFKVREGWLQLYEICYDYERSIPLYSRHTVYGNAIEGAFEGSERPGFRMSGLPSNLSMNNAYKKKSQENTFKNILGESGIRYLKDDYLARGHLAPDADFMMNSWQRATYYFANVAPQWQSINGGNWRKLENSIKSSAASKGQVYKIYTGTSGVLELKDNNGNDVPVFLAKNNRLPVPMYLWKMVCNSQQNCITFVSYNSVEKHVDPCSNICKETKWHKEGFDDVSKGIMYCCDSKKVSRVLEGMPILTVKNILNY